MSLEFSTPPAPPVIERIDLSPDLAGASPTSMDWVELFTSTQKALARLEMEGQTEGDRLFIRRLIKRLEERDEGIEPYPQVSRFIDKLIGNDEGDAYRIGKLVNQDERLQRAVMVAASSFQYTRPPSSMKAAIARLGHADLWRLGLTIPIGVHLYRIPRMAEAVYRMRMHAYGTGHVAAWLTETSVGPPFLAGLIHDLGRILIHRAAIRLLKGPNPDPAFVDRVQVQLHASVGAIMAYHWNMDPGFIAATAFHNHPGKAPDAHKRLAWVIHVSDLVARTAGAEWDGLESNGRELLGRVRHIQFDMEEAIDQAHDAFNHFETIEAGIDAQADETRG